jgi:cyclopropane-fatty-acyl-phospholipid synthase
MKSRHAIAMNMSEKGIVPDQVLRLGIRQLLKARLNELHVDDIQSVTREKMAFIEEMGQSSIALVPEKANEQHYEVPSKFFMQVLGQHMKYSCGYWAEDTNDLDLAETLALVKTCRHADLHDGQDILELGCGWGSLTLWMAENFPNSRITAVSNSNSQGEFIRQQATHRQLSNVQVITADINHFQPEGHFDRVVSVEMFEHLRNYHEIYHRISDWLKPQGKFFKHIFVHRSCVYPFVDRTSTDWMSRYFFSGGMMPSDDLPHFFQEHLTLEKQWRWDGRHYEKTANAWLKKMDEAKESLRPMFEDTYGKDFAMLWWRRWRLFFMACAELFGYDNGQQWWVSHYLFKKP